MDHFYVKLYKLFRRSTRRIAVDTLTDLRNFVLVWNMIAKFDNYYEAEMLVINDDKRSLMTALVLPNGHTTMIEWSLKIKKFNKSLKMESFRRHKKTVTIDRQDRRRQTIQSGHLVQRNGIWSLFVRRITQSNHRQSWWEVSRHRHNRNNE